MSSTKLRDLIREIRSCKTAAEERALVAREKAYIRNSFKEDDSSLRARNVAKLLFINMMGHDTDFGQLDCLKLITSSSFTDKRIGYLGVTCLFNEKSEVLMMATHRIRTDLNSSILPVQALALTAISEICTSDMCRELCPEILKMMPASAGSNYIKKKAILTCSRIVRKVPDLIDEIADKVIPLLSEKHHGIVLSALGLVEDILACKPDTRAKFRKYVGQLVSLLKTIAGNYSAEYDVNGVPDPFLQMQIIKMFRLVGQGDAKIADEISEILAHVATNTTSAKNTGNAVLYECVKTIMSIDAPQSLRSLGVNILGKFLANKDNNSKYVSLFALQQVLKFDMGAVQKHKTTILECLQENDISIKKMAVDLLALITNESNIKSIVKEMLNYLLVADVDFIKDLTMKICYCVERYSPTRRWQIDSIIKVLTMAGNHVMDDNISALVHLIMSTPQLQLYAISKIYFSLRENVTQEGLIKVGLWCFGEFGQLLTTTTTFTVRESELLDVIKRILARVNTPDQTKELALTCLMKMYSKFPSLQREITTLIEGFTTAMSLEVQQRACEYHKLIETGWNNKLSAIFEPIPILPNAATSFQDKPIGDAEIDEIPATATGGSKASAGGDLLGDGLFGGSTGTTTQDTKKEPPKQGGGLLEFDLIFGGAPQPAQPAQPPKPVAAPVQQPPAQKGSGLLDMNLFDQPPVATTPSQGLHKPAQSPSGGLDFLNMGAPTQPVTTTPQSGAGLHDLLGGGITFNTGPTKPAQPAGGLDFLNSTPLTATTPTSGAGGLKIKAAEDENIEIWLTLNKKDQPDQSSVVSLFNNKKFSQITDLVYQVAALKHLKLQMNPINSNTIPANSKEQTHQSMIVTNTMQGTKGIVLKLRVTYALDGRTFLIEKAITDIPVTF